MRYFDEPVRLEVNTNVRPALLHLMGNHDPGPLGSRKICLSWPRRRGP